MPRLVRPPFGLLVLAVSVLPAGGCSSGPTICRVTGTVRYKGKPVPNLTVRFVPDEGRASIGTTDESGVFKLTYEKNQEGAARGKHKVYFLYRPRNPKEDMDIQTGKATPPPVVTAILTKYGSLENTPLSFEVTTDGQDISIDLD